jgi:hypothetical protein
MDTKIFSIRIYRKNHTELMHLFPYATYNDLISDHLYSWFYLETHEIASVSSILHKFCITVFECIEIK